MDEEELALDRPDEDGVTLIIKVNPETEEVESVEDLE